MTQIEENQYLERIALRGVRGLLSDSYIKRFVNNFEMIEPFFPEQVKINTNGDPVISYGLSSFGYDIRVANEFRIFSPSTGTLTCIDPKAIDKRTLISFCGDVCVIPPNSFALARSIEYFKMPANVLGLCLGKSTYARAGIITNFTPFEPGWCGHVTIEISNTTPLPCKIYADEGIAQVLFLASEFPLTTYAQRDGKYQNQVGITLAKV